MMRNLVAAIMIWICIFANQSRGQSIDNIFTPRIGDTLPEHTFTDVRNYGNDNLSLSELRGKWLVMDFWSKDCSGCLKSFSKMNQLHKDFKSKITVLMVGTVGSIQLKSSGKVIEREKPTKQIYDRLERLYDLKFPVAFDSLLARTYGIGSLPYIIVADPNGIIRGITTSVNEEAIHTFLSGRQPLLNRAYTGSELDVMESKINNEKSAEESSKNLAVNNQEIKSVLGLYNRVSMGVMGALDLNNPDLKSTKKALNEGLFETSAMLNSLFYTAYFGVTMWYSDNSHPYKNYSKDFVFETKDSLQFLTPNNVRYAYSLSVPESRADTSFFKKIMQKDLEVYFGLKGRVEKRLMPVYYLKVSDKRKAKKLVTAGKEDRFTYDVTLPKAHQIVLNNSPMETLCEFIGGFTGTKEPIFDGTGFKEHIDIDLRAYIYELDEIEKALEPYGLVLEKGVKELETIIISDSDIFL